ncbi:MAG: hypothetical protein IR160_04275 [Salinibacterium sp.]|nr:hypothetical protein [Salinibacterium sp.]MBF0671784.1 hypothetical protein [Salinibacterium sp.]
MIEDNDQFRLEGDWNSFAFEPNPRPEDVIVVGDRAKELGYRLVFREAGSSLEGVKTVLREVGPSAFLNDESLQHDVSPKAPTPVVEQFLSERLVRLAPESELIITDPYMFTKSRRNDAVVYAASVAGLIAPLLSDGVVLTVVVDPAVSDSAVEVAVRQALIAKSPSLVTNVVHSSDFHDRFWIADRTRGTILGTSLNKIGGKIFFVDALDEHDVEAVVAELASRGV